MNAQLIGVLMWKHYETVTTLMLNPGEQALAQLAEQFKQTPEIIK